MAEFTEVMKQKERMCEYHDTKFGVCDYCDLHKASKHMSCNGFMEKHPQETEEIIMKWAKKHPVKTNADKFKEVFGIECENCCPISPEFCFKEDMISKCNNCKYHDFWNQEYKEPSEV